MVKESFKESRRGETKQNRRKIVYRWQCKQKGKAKERRVSSNGNGFRVQKAKGKKKEKCSSTLIGRKKLF